LQIGIGIALSIIKFEYSSRNYHAHVRNNKDKKRKVSRK